MVRHGIRKRSTLITRQNAMAGKNILFSMKIKREILIFKLATNERLTQFRVLNQFLLQVLFKSDQTHSSVSLTKQSHEKNIPLNCINCLLCVHNKAYQCFGNLILEAHEFHNLEEISLLVYYKYTIIKWTTDNFSQVQITVVVTVEIVADVLFII